jgi:signal transduction histidine kinase
MSEDNSPRKVTHGTLLAPSVSWKVTVAVIWLGFSVALAIWWMIYGLSQIDRLSQIAGDAPHSLTLEFTRQHRMLLSEGATLVLLLLGGGIALLYHIRREMQRGEKLREFFGAFTHDLKTSLASLRLQAESLEEDLRESDNERLAKRLVKDTVRLELQLENSLFLASPDDNSRFHMEPIHLRDVFQPMRHHWPDLEVDVDGDATVLSDQRALESIFKNLLQNAVVHGRANQVRIKVERTSSHVTIRVSDNGRGFSGDMKRLGLAFERHGSSSGSGLGLYLARKLARKLRGELHFVEHGAGFTVDVVLPEAHGVESAG